MGGSLSEGLRIIFAIVITCLIIGFVFVIWSTTKETGNSALTQANKLNVAMAESEYTQYDGAFITGSEVYNVIKQHSNDDICIKVITTGGGTTFYICDASLTPIDATTQTTNMNNARKKSEASYINPNSKFYGSVIKNDNDTIIGVVFDQSGNPATSL